VVVTFLYTRCPDVCPLIASQLNEALRELGPARDRLRVLAVSVDPKGDTPAMVRWFIRKHHLLPQFRYLTGTAKQLQPIWDGYHVAAQVGAPDVSLHSAYELLIDPKGKARLRYDAGLQARDLVHDLRALGAVT
jgi:protein SCO1